MVNSRMDARAGMIRRILRTDADDEESEETPKGSGGNTRLPFGLCKKFGIKLPEGATPKDAWDALAGKGIKANAVYAHLEKYGTVEDFGPRSEKDSSEEQKKSCVYDLDLDEETKKDFAEYRKGINTYFEKAKELIEKEDYDLHELGESRPKATTALVEMEKKVFSAECGKDVTDLYNSTMGEVSAIENIVRGYEKLNRFKQSLKSRIEDQEDEGEYYILQKDDLDENIKYCRDKLSEITSPEDTEIKEYLSKKLDEMQNAADHMSEIIDKERLERAKKVKEERIAKEEERAKTRGQKRKIGIKQHEHFDSVDAMAHGISDKLGITVRSLSEVPGLRDMDDEAVERVNKISDALLTMKENYGIAPKVLYHGDTGLIQGDKSKTAMAYWQSTASGVANLGLCNLFSGSNEPKNKSFSRWGVSLSTEAIIVHESGHGLMNRKTLAPYYEDAAKAWTLIYSKYRKKYAKELKNGEMSNDDITDLTDSHAVNEQLTGFKDFHKNEGLQRFMTVHKAYIKAAADKDILKLSQYAYTSDSEFFAETFTAYVLGEDLPDYMVDMVEEFID